MKIETENRADHQVAFTVELAPERLDEARRKAARRLSKKTKIPGFRPGKAPFKVLVRHLGEEVVQEEAVKGLIDEVYPQVIEEVDLHPYGPGSLEAIESTEPPVFKFLVPLAPEVELGDYRSIRIPYEQPEITDQDVENSLKILLNNMAKLEKADRPAQENDLVYISLKATALEPDESEEGVETEITLLNQNFVPVIIESDGGKEEEWPFEGFAKELIGLEAGGEKTIAHEFPEDGEDELFQGKTVQFTIKVNSINSRTLPELNDELAQKVSEKFSTLDDLKEDIRSQLEQNSREKYDSDYVESVVDRILEESEIKYPPQVLEEEIKTVINEIKSRLARQNMDLETYLKTREITEAQFREEVQPTAEERVRRGIILMEIANQEGVQVDEGEVTADVSQTIKAINASLPRRDVKKLLNQNAISGMINRAVSESMIHQTLDLLASIAKGELEAEEKEEPVEQAEPEEVASHEAGDSPEEEPAPDAAEAIPEKGVEEESEVSPAPDTQE